MRIDLAGAAPVAIARDVGEFVRTATWGRDGTIVFDGTRLLMRVAATGGEPALMTALTEGDAAAAPGRLAHLFPHFIPDSDLFLFTSYAYGYRGELRIGSPSTGTSQGLMPVSSGYAPFLPPDRVVYLQEGELRALRIDLAHKSLVGTPETLAVGVPETGAGGGAFSVSATGSLAYRTGEFATELAWFDRNGRRLARAAAPDAAPQVIGVRLPPDGTRIALDRSVDGNRDVWVLDAARGSLTRLTADPVAAGLPVWSPDGQSLAYESFRSGVWNLNVRSASGQGAEERLQESAKSQIPLDWSRDGRFLLYVEGDTVTMADGDLLALPMTGSARRPLPIATTGFNENGGRFSPDGRWVAYEPCPSTMPVH
jgi:eukaryotic-like serine/threonine-protein kinase